MQVTSGISYVSYLILDLEASGVSALGVSCFLEASRFSPLCQMEKRFCLLSLGTATTENC